MKKFLIIPILLLSFFAGFEVFSHSGNALAAGLTTFSLSYLGSFLAPALPSFSSLLCTLAHVKRAPCGTPNPGGGHKLWLAPADQFSTEWGQVHTEGVIQTAPTFEAGFAGWIECEVSDNSLKLDQSLKGASGYQAWESTFEVKVAGDTAAQTVAVTKLVNTEVVAIIELNDLQRKNIGSTLFPLSFEITHTTGAKGSDQRGWTLKAKNDGLSYPSFFLKSDIALSVAGAPAPPAGG